MNAPGQAQYANPVTCAQYGLANMIAFGRGDEAGEILASTADKDQAVAMARQAAQERRAQLIVHLENGDIEWTEDYAWAEAERQSTVPPASV